MSAPLTQAECLQWIQLARDGDQAALSRVVKLNLPLVTACLRRFAGHGRDMEELYQQGCLGLVKAVKRFDASFGVQFSTYAVPFILGEIRRFFRDDSPVHVPRRDKERLLAVRKASHQLRQSLNREPTVPEIAQALRMEPAELMLLMESSQSPVSMDETPAGAAEGSRSLWDVLADPRSENWMERFMLKDLLGRLPSREQKLVYLRYQAGRTQSETARILGMTQVQVSRLEARVRLELKKEWNSS